MTIQEPKDTMYICTGPHSAAPSAHMTELRTGSPMHSLSMIPSPSFAAERLHTPGSHTRYRICFALNMTGSAPVIVPQNVCGH